MQFSGGRCAPRGDRVIRTAVAKCRFGSDGGHRRANSDRLKRADSDRSPNGGNGRDSGGTRATGKAWSEHGCRNPRLRWVPSPIEAAEPFGVRIPPPIEVVGPQRHMRNAHQPTPFRFAKPVTVRALKTTALTSAANSQNATGSPADFATRPIAAGPTRTPA